MVERELLRAGMQLDPARAAGQCALDLGERVVVRVEPGEREEAALTALGLVDHHVVGGGVTVGLVHREDEGPGVDPLE